MKKIVLQCCITTVDLKNSIKYLLKRLEHYQSQFEYLKNNPLPLILNI